MLKPNWLSSNDFESELPRLFAEFALQAPTVVLFLQLKDRLIVGLPGRQHVVDDARQFVGCGGDGFRSPEFSAHAAIEVPRSCYRNEAPGSVPYLV